MLHFSSKGKPKTNNPMTTIFLLSSSCSDHSTTPNHQAKSLFAPIPVSSSDEDEKALIIEEY
jgi:hypothetical protein